MNVVLRSFGLPRHGRRNAIGFPEAQERLRARSVPDGGILPFGNGRSYGDTCLNDTGLLVDMRSENRILSFDAETGVMEAEAGILLSEIIAHAAPYGWFPAVVPGTRFVTLGGAIANDIHGKNHHRRGTFGRHVESLRLLRSDSVVQTISPASMPELFAATVSGMGLTGIVLSARMRLMRVSSPDVVEAVTPFSGLDAYFDLAEPADLANEYAVAWIDQLAHGRNAGRGLLMTANHADGEAPASASRPARLGVPFRPPVNLINRPALRLFNTAYRHAKSRSREARRVAFGSYFFPLDGLRNWNRLYGPRGLYQHQSVVPEEAARHAVPQLLEAARQAGEASFLTVLKRFGDLPSPGLTSFPRPGYTLTLDFPNRGARTLALLDRLDAITLDAGGAVNPYKDARMAPETFGRSFPDWRRLEAQRDPAVISDFWRRTAGELLPHAGRLPLAAE